MLESAYGFFMDFREYLQSEFSRIKRKKANYSLRAFAKSLGVSAPTLSGYLNQKRSLSFKKKIEIAKRMSLSQGVISALEIEGINAISETLPNDQSHSLKYGTLQGDRLIAFEIYQLSKISGFQLDSAWISKKLGYPKNVIDDLVKELRLQGIFEPKSTEKHASTIVKFNSESEFEEILKRLNERSLNSLKTVSRDHRYHHFFCIPTIPEDVSQIKNAYLEFISKVDKISRMRRNKNAVYLMSFSAFPITLDQSNTEVKSEKNSA